MSDTSSPLTLGKLLRQSGSLFVKKGPTLLALGAFPPVLLCILSVTLVTAIHPDEHFDAVAFWRNMSVLAKVGIFALILSMQALVFRSYAAAIVVAAEWSRGRETGPVSAYLRVRRKSLRIPWVCFLCGLLVGPLVLFGAFFLSLFAFPGFPAAVLEGSGARDSLKRGWKVFKEQVGLLAGVYSLYFGACIAVIIAFVAGMMALQALPFVARPVASAILLTFLLLPSVWFVSVLTLAYLGIKEQAPAASAGGVDVAP